MFKLLTVMACFYCHCIQSDSLYSIHVGPYQAAYKYLSCLKPLEPEMWLALTSTKMSWTPSRRKRFMFSIIENLCNNATYQKYLCRPANYRNLHFLQWLRLIDEKKGVEYKSGSTLVGVKMVSPLKDFFFLQYLVVKDLLHTNHEQLSPQIKHFASAYTLMNDFWSQTHKVHTYFTEHGHKAWFIDTLICHIVSLADYFNLYQRRVLTTTNIIPQPFLAQSATDDPLQQ